MRRAFTLIELLVVISIISLLSSVVMASLNSARDKGRLAAGKQFDANVYHAAADQAVGIWDFDECAATSTDRAGYGATATFFFGYSMPADGPYGTGCAPSLGVSSGFGEAWIGSQFDFSTGWTVSAWVRRNGTAGNNSDGSTWKVIVRKGINHTFNLGTDNVTWKPTAGTYTNTLTWTGVTGTTQLAQGQWYHIVGTFDTANSGTVKIYVNGALEATATNRGVPQGNANQMWLGGSNNLSSVSTFWPMSLDNVRVYAKALTAADIGNIYAEERGRHVANALE